MFFILVVFSLLLQHALSICLYFIREFCIVAWEKIWIEGWVGHCSSQNRSHGNKLGFLCRKVLRWHFLLPWKVAKGKGQQWHLAFGYINRTDVLPGASFWIPHREEFILKIKSCRLGTAVKCPNWWCLQKKKVLCTKLISDLSK